MKDPIPESALPYNTTPRPRPKKWFGWLSPKDFEGFHMPFAPLLIVFLSFILSLVYEVSLLRHRTVELRIQNVRLGSGIQKANEQLAFIQGLHTDLQAMAPSHPAADALLKEFFPDIHEPDTTSKAADGTPK
jgi:hypothetical protein